MHRYAEYGKASHWLYKAEEGRPVREWQVLSEGADETTLAADSEAAAFASALFEARNKSPRAGGGARRGGGTRTAGRGGASSAAAAFGVGGAGDASGAPPQQSPEQTRVEEGFSMLERLRRSLRERRVCILFLHPDTHSSHMSHTPFSQISEFHSFLGVRCGAHEHERRVRPGALTLTGCQPAGCAAGMPRPRCNQGSTIPLARRRANCEGQWADGAPRLSDTQRRRLDS